MRTEKVNKTSHGFADDLPPIVDFGKEPPAGTLPPDDKNSTTSKVTTEAPVKTTSEQDISRATPIHYHDLKVSLVSEGKEEKKEEDQLVVSERPQELSTSQNLLKRITMEFGIDAKKKVEDPADDRVFESENRKGLLKEFTRAAYGLDLVHISLPVSLNEPLSFLQKMCEQIGYYELLDKANVLEDSCQRLMYMVAFVASQYSLERTTKPFNPLLGETFEYVNDEKIRFVAEQVSHHPPIGASHAENDNFTYDSHFSVKTRFAGNSVPCEEIGMHHVTLKRHGDVFTWPGFKTVVHNVIVGKLWIDHFGEMELRNETTGDKAKIEFTECGWFSKGRYEVSGVIMDSKGTKRISFKGKRNESISITVIKGPSFPDNKEIIWRHDSLQSDQNDPWKLNPFSKGLNILDPFLNDTLPETDSRFRPDRLALEKQDLKRASAEKKILETIQREQAKARQQADKTWIPRYFEKVENLQHDCYKFKENYWKQREERIEKRNVKLP